MKKIIYMSFAALSLFMASCGGGDDNNGGATPPIVTPETPDQQPGQQPGQQPSQQPDQQPEPQPQTFEAPQWRNDMAKLQQQADFEHTMSIYVALPEELRSDADANDLLAVFCGDQLRGLATCEDGSNGVWMALVYGNDGESMAFQYYSAKKRHMYTSPTPFSFGNNSQYGTLAKPETITLNVVMQK